MNDSPRPPERDAPLEPDPMLGVTLADRYRITELVARGGMSRVYRARDERLDRDVAVKVLAPPYADDPEFIERFLAEARAAASLSHPSLVHVYDSGTDGAAHYIVMELLEGHRTLRQVLTEHGRLSVAEAGRIGLELLAGLRVVHERGLVHCDVKAANVMLGPGPAKLIDFGIARSPTDAARTGTSIGTLSSMSPEQLAGEPLTPASDLFSLGTVLYEALTGRVPFPGLTPDEVREAHARGEVTPPSRLAPGIPPRLDGLVLQSLRREPEARFRSADAMARALGLALEETPRAEPERRRAGANDETRVVPVPRGYVPPPVARDQVGPRIPEPRPFHPTEPPARVRGRRRRGGGIANFVGTLLVLAAAAAVVLFVVVPLLGLRNGESGSGGSPTPSSAASSAGPTGVPGVIPDTIGLSFDEAVRVATEAGLNWTVRCNHDESKPEGIIDQEPPPGTQVAPGGRFTMFSARIEDCRGGGGDDEGGGGGGNGNGGGRGGGNRGGGGGG
ncbi:MAG TPA: protein kinase [Candidatus Limnocylindria bacterium]|nr:protein kinase [Candidatus Limnocylindria bacterium]